MAFTLTVRTCCVNFRPFILDGHYRTFSSMSQPGNYPYGYKPIRVTNQGSDRQAARRPGARPSGKSYKVLLIGESGVGKSTLIGRLCEDKFLTELRKYTLGERDE